MQSTFWHHKQVHSLFGIHILIPTRLNSILISYDFEAVVTCGHKLLIMRLSTAAFIALAVRTAGLRVILDTDLGDDIDDTWALSALLQA